MSLVDNVIRTRLHSEVALVNQVSSYITNSGGKRNKQSSELVILTRSHTQIEWGRPVNTNKPFELSAAEKIKNLCRVLDVSPQLQGIKVVKVQFDQPYIVLQEPAIKKNPSAQSPRSRSR